MLDDLERRRLADIEASLSSDDPLLARKLGIGIGIGIGIAPSPRRTAATAAAFVVLTVLAVWLGILLAGTAAGIAAGLTMWAVAAGLVLQRRHRNLIDPPPDA